MRFGVFLSLAIALLLTSLSARVHAEDGPRVHAGAYLHGALVASRGAADGGPGVGAQVGVQIDDRWAIYAAPELDFLFAQCCGVLGSSLIVEHTFGDAVSIGAGPGAGLAVVFSGRDGPEDRSSWAQFGGDLRIAWHLARRLRHEGDERHARQRDAFTLGLVGGVYSNGEDVVVMPRLALGYTRH